VNSIKDNVTFTSIEGENRFKNKTDEFSFLLKPSKIAGVGVFVTHNIKKGTRLRLFKRPERIIWANDVDKIPHLRKFTDFFGVIEGKFISIPEDFSSMCVGWYMNHSDKPNAVHDERYRYFAKNDIKAGEEITIDYREL
jgi:SET domain-containing protein